MVQEKLVMVQNKSGVLVVTAKNQAHAMPKNKKEKMTGKMHVHQ